jgi:hypothetical protein
MNFKILLSEITTSIKKEKDKLVVGYFNERMGDTSFHLGAVLEQILKNNFNNWEHDRWIDDSLLTKVKSDANKISIWGIIIWGRLNTTEQWTDPFYFEVILNSDWSDFIEFTFLYEEDDISEITYDEFRKNRNMWDIAFYSDKNWNPSERDWKYIFNQKNTRLHGV